MTGVHLTGGELAKVRGLLRRMQRADAGKDAYRRYAVYNLADKICSILARAERRARDGGGKQ